MLGGTRGAHWRFLTTYSPRYHQGHALRCICYPQGNDTLKFGDIGMGDTDSTVQLALVIVYFSGNDSMRAHPSGLDPHVPLPEYVKNMRKIVAHVKNLSEKTRVILLTAPPINEDQILKVFGGVLSDLGRKNELCKIYSDACLKLCEEMNIKAIDLWTAIQRKADWKTTCFMDGIHFSSEGIKIVAKEILRVIKESDWEPSLDWELMPMEFRQDSPYYPVAPDGNTTVNESHFIFLSRQ